jgi:aspartyl-tRNA(Asn)/glutamyl-tRNA(Gln) amidotransferase subunit A
MADVTRYPLWKLAELLSARKLSSVELCRAYFERIEKYDGELGAYLYLNLDDALKQAEAADDRISNGSEVTPLTGIPVAIKDVLIQHGAPATCGSKILKGFKPQFDGTAVAKLRAAGAVFPGRVNMDEFAMGSSNEFSGYYPVKNPWDYERIPGGSSGGSAAAVSACLAAAALGTDTGGSVRQPAAMTGIVGLKPTYGRVSRFGLVAFGSSLDCIGPMTRTVRDNAILLETIAGHDPKDSTSQPEPVNDYSSGLTGDIKGLRVGILPEVEDEGIDPEVKAAFEKSLSLLRDAGAEIREVTVPHFKYAIPAYYIVACAEASSNLSRYDGIRYGLREKGYTDLADQYFRTRTAGFGPEVKRRIMLGTFVLSSGYYDAYYKKGTDVRALIKRELAEVFDAVDLIATPTAPTPAWKFGEKVDDPIQMYLADIFTVTANLAGVPAISINCGFTKNKLPIGFQFIAPHLQEGRLLNAAFTLEEALGLASEGPLE